MAKLARLVIIMAIAGIVAPALSAAEDLPTIDVWKDPACGCCGKWVAHMRAAGFRVVVNEVTDMTPVKRKAGIPEALQSCHTAIIAGYRIEGHVPAEDIKRLLAARPKIAGLAVPGMPAGSPGMEGGAPQHYHVVGFDQAGRTHTFAHH